MKLSLRAWEWMGFSDLVKDHIENYTVPQYGDKGSDLCSEYTVEHCMKQIEKYVRRYKSNQRPGERQRDFLKIAHYAQMAHTIQGDVDGQNRPAKEDNWNVWRDASED